MRIKKSARHSKITGDFGERLVLYWLSKYGFESMYVDHVGMDIVARNPHTNDLMGISVKSRSRNAGSEGTAINVQNDSIDKLDVACKSFDCNPYFAIIADEANTIMIYIISAAHLVKLYKPGKRVISWKMTDDSKRKYLTDPNIIIFRMTTETVRWWGKASKLKS